ncbi:GreA/GreB family elongation factor [Pseudonocardia nantongensis]|uniref:GreA/GreB family elongation factor n=1 Tax=Pseudonocardia nantongensis TaxID=1181885 RepID=UPI00397948E0
MTDTHVWLAEGAYQNLRTELRELLARRDDEGSAGPDGTDHQLLAEQRGREQRIRRLQELLRDPVVGHRPPDDGVAEPGMVLTVRYEQDGEVETFLLAHSGDGAYPADLMLCSPDSPLGRALPGTRQGERLHYRLPDGGALAVTLLRAVPYGEHRAAS